MTRERADSQSVDVTHLVASPSTEQSFASLTVCVPAFNEADVIVDTLAALRKELPGAEIILVDDGSSDDTSTRAKAVRGVILLSEDRNRGYGASLKLAMRRAKGDVIAWFDADGQHHPADLRRVVAPVLSGERDAVIGVRPASGSPLDRRPGKWLLKMVAQIIVRARIPDLNSGLRCFRRDAIKKYLHLLPDGFSASSTSTLLMMKRGYRLGYVRIDSRPRTGNSTVRPIRDGWRTIKILVRMLVLFEAFGFFTLLSILQTVPGTIYGVYIALRNMEGFPTLASTVILSGLLTFFMGLLCDQITAMRLESLEDGHH